MTCFQLITAFSGSRPFRRHFCFLGGVCFVFNAAQTIAAHRERQIVVSSSVDKRYAWTTIPRPRAPIPEPNRRESIPKIECFVFALLRQVVVRGRLRRKHLPHHAVLPIPELLRGIREPHELFQARGVASGLHHGETGGNERSVVEQNTCEHRRTGSAVARDICSSCIRFPCGSSPSCYF